MVVQPGLGNALGHADPDEVGGGQEQATPDPTHHPDTSHIAFVGGSGSHLSRLLRKEGFLYPGEADEEAMRAVEMEADAEKQQATLRSLEKKAKVGKELQDFLEENTSGNERLARFFGSGFRRNPKGGGSGGSGGPSLQSDGVWR